MILKRFILLMCIFFSIVMFASDYPIIFIHGIKEEARPEGTNEHPEWKDKGGWGTWYPRKRDGSFNYHTAMTRIVAEHYKGYDWGITSAGSPLNCSLLTNLEPTGGERRKIYNFSFYFNNTPGVISISKESVLVYFSHIYDVFGEDVLVVNDLPQSIESSELESGIPPTLPSWKSDYVRDECCIIPFWGFFIFRNIFRKEGETIGRPGVIMGINFSPGIAYSGSRLSRILETGECDPFHRFYLNYRSEFDIQYLMKGRWYLKVFLGYMWAKLDKRMWPFWPSSPPSGGGDWGHRSWHWELSTYTGGIEIVYNWGEKVRKNMGLGIEYNQTTGRYPGWFVEVFPGSYNTGEELKGDGIFWGRGMGIFFDIGFDRKIIDMISMSFSLTIRTSLAKTYKSEIPDWAYYSEPYGVEPLIFRFTGIYTKIGLNYILAHI